MLERRSFLRAMLAAAAAPAIVRAESLMPLWVPKPQPIFTGVDLVGPGGDWTVEAWMDVGRVDAWAFVVTRCVNGKVEHSVDGKAVPGDHHLAFRYDGMRKVIMPGSVFDLDSQVGGIRVTQGMEPRAPLRRSDVFWPSRDERVEILRL